MISSAASARLLCGLLFVGEKWTDGVACFDRGVFEVTPWENGVLLATPGVLVVDPVAATDPGPADSCLDVGVLPAGLPSLSVLLADFPDAGVLPAGVPDPGVLLGCFPEAGVFAAGVPVADVLATGVAEAGAEVGCDVG